MKLFHATPIRSILLLGTALPTVKATSASRWTLDNSNLVHIATTLPSSLEQTERKTDEKDHHSPRIRRLQTPDEICNVLLQENDFLLVDCVCTPLTNGDYILDCSDCAEGVTAVHRNLSYAPRTVIRYVPLTSRQYAIQSVTYAERFFGNDRNFTTVETTIYQLDENNNRDLSRCDYRIDGKICNCTRIFNERQGLNQPVIDCPNLTLPSCDSSFSCFPGSDQILFDYNPCYGPLLPPSEYNQNTFAPTPTPPGAPFPPPPPSVGDPPVLVIPSSKAPTRSPFVVSSEEVCDALIQENNILEDCICTSLDEGEFSLDCLDCVGSIPAINADLEYVPRTILRYWPYANNRYVLRSNTYQETYSGTDRNFTTVETTYYYLDSGTFDTTLCDYSIDGTDCNCTLSPDGSFTPIIQCPTFTLESCDSPFTNCFPGSSDILFDYNTCYGPFTPTDFHGGTLAPALAPSSSSSASPATAEPPYVLVGGQPCQNNSECQGFVNVACIWGVCSPPQPPGGPCDGLPNESGTIDDSDCQNFACGRRIGLPDANYVCCESGKWVHPPESDSLDQYCTGLSGGTPCVSNETCTSFECLANGVCNGPTIALPTADPSMQEPVEAPINVSIGSPMEVPVETPSAAIPMEEPVEAPVNGPVETSEDEPPVTTAPSLIVPDEAPVVVPSEADPASMPDEGSVVQPTEEPNEEELSGELPTDSPIPEVPEDVAPVEGAPAVPLTSAGVALAVDDGIDSWYAFIRLAVKNGIAVLGLVGYFL